MVDKATIIKSIIFTLISINLMMVALIVGKEVITITTSIPSMGKETSKPQQTIQYAMEKVGTDRIKAQHDGQGFWVVEHYKQYEYHYDTKGNFIDKRPTNKAEHLRYWEKAK